MFLSGRPLENDRRSKGKRKRGRRPTNQIISPSPQPLPLYGHMSSNSSLPLLHSHPLHPHSTHPPLHPHTTYSPLHTSRSSHLSRPEPHTHTSPATLYGVSPLSLQWPLKQHTVSSQSYIPHPKKLYTFLDAMSPASKKPYNLSPESHIFSPSKLHFVPHATHPVHPRYIPSPTLHTLSFTH